MPLPRCRQQMLLMFPAYVVPDYALPTFADTWRAGSGPVSGCEEPTLANYHLFHFHQFQCVLAPIHWTRVTDSWQGVVLQSTLLFYTIYQANMVWHPRTLYCMILCTSHSCMISLNILLFVSNCVPASLVLVLTTVFVKTNCYCVYSSFLVAGLQQMYFFVHISSYVTMCLFFCANNLVSRI